MKNKLLTLILVLIMCISLAACSSGNKDSESFSAESTESSEQSLYAELFEDCVKTEVGSIINATWDDDNNGTIPITVTMPDFEKIYSSCINSSNRDEELINILESGEYPTITIESTAPIAKNDDDTVIDTDSAVLHIIESEFIKAINSVTED